MPTYRFDVRDGRTIRDPHGLDLADDDAARRHGQLLAQNLGPMVGGHINLFVDVVDEDGNVVATYEVSWLPPAADVVGAFVYSVELEADVCFISTFTETGNSDAAAIALNLGTMAFRTAISFSIATSSQDNTSVSPFSKRSFSVVTDVESDCVPAMSVSFAARLPAQVISV